MLCVSLIRRNYGGANGNGTRSNKKIVRSADHTQSDNDVELCVLCRLYFFVPVASGFADCGGMAVQPFEKKPLYTHKKLLGTFEDLAKLEALEKLAAELEDLQEL